MKVLQSLRTSMPSKDSHLVERICRGHKAWTGPEPDVGDVLRLLTNHPDTNIVTCTRRGAAFINDLAMKALYGNKRLLVTLPGDIESVPENYDGGEAENRRPPHPLRCLCVQGHEAVPHAQHPQRR